MSATKPRSQRNSILQLSPRYFSINNPNGIPFTNLHAKFLQLSPTFKNCFSKRPLFNVFFNICQKPSHSYMLSASWQDLVSKLEIYLVQDTYHPIWFLSLGYFCISTSTPKISLMNGGIPTLSFGHSPRTNPATEEHYHSHNVPLHSCFPWPLQFP